MNSLPQGGHAVVMPPIGLTGYISWIRHEKQLASRWSCCGYVAGWPSIQPATRLPHAQLATKWSCYGHATGWSYRLLAAWQSDAQLATKVAVLWSCRRAFLQAACHKAVIRTASHKVVILWSCHRVVLQYPCHKAVIYSACHKGGHAVVMPLKGLTGDMP